MYRDTFAPVENSRYRKAGQAGHALRADAGNGFVSRDEATAADLPARARNRRRRPAESFEPRPLLDACPARRGCPL